MKLEDFLRRSIDRRTAMKAGTATFLASQMALFEGLASAPQRIALASSTPSDIQFDIGAFVHPAQTFNDGAGNVVADFGVTFTMFAPARLRRTPSKFDQAVLDEALETIEAHFPFSPAGAFVFTLYGVPYFNRLPQALVAAAMPRLASNHSRFVLEESPAFPTDFTGGAGTQNPDIVKDRFNVPVVIETNDVLFEMRSDNLNNLSNILAWLQGSNNLNGSFVASPDFDGLFNFATPRVIFVQPGLPRKVADNAFANFAQGNLLYEYHGRINPDSSMVMGFVDQQVDSSAPNGATVTFVGDPNNRNTQGFTTARAGDYFDNGAIAHLSHDIDDLFQFYSLPNQDSRRTEGEPFTERVQYMFRSNQINSGFFGLPTLNAGNADQFTDGGGAAFVNNVFQGAGAALAAAQDKDGKTTAQTNQDINATFSGEPRVGHEEALQRSSRAADGTPLHIRNDGPGFDTLDVPAFQDFPGGTNFAAGTTQFKLHFLAFVPTSEFFRQMRVNVAAQDFQAQFLAGQDDNNGLERFITATRRQNFLCPPRRHRAFPLVEFT
ncbi:MAG TPA: hypothetical protein VE953_05840 [Terriglobales bacterium]|nr:hypothetical protein [Terriglobales bacterium]